MGEQEKELLEKSRKYAGENGLMLNPDKKIVDAIIKGLLRNKKEKGEIYCPCRPVTGDKGKDRDIICPCIFHKKEIEEDGKCHCRLFVRKE